MPVSRRNYLSIVLGGGEPPSEFRLFRAGSNETTKGTFIFDDVSAKSVMAEYQAHGIDLMVDYDHASLAGLSIDPAQSGKAAGWFQLEVRNGELWAVNVRWTEPAAEALRRKEWRFMSPAFSTDGEGRVTSVLNVALTNLPATRKLDPLMAANIKSLGGCMDPELVKRALEALQAGDAEACMAILAEVIASAATGEESSEPPEDTAPPAEDMVPAAENTPPPAEDAAAKDDQEEMHAVAAATSALMRLTGKASFVDAVREAEVWRQSHIRIEEESKRLNAERAAIELSTRKANAKRLIELGAETPHTSGLASGTLVKRLLDEPIEEQKARIEALAKAGGGSARAALTPPVGGGDGSQDFDTPEGKVTLSASEIAECKRAGAKPEIYAANKAVRLKNRGK